MATVSLLRWITCWAVAGIATAAVLLAIFTVSPSSWHQHLDPWFLVLFPPSILLMATEVCPGWLSWCSAQYMLLASLLNSLLYLAVGATLWLAVWVLSSLLGRRGAA
jgi:hypothetical protein